MADNQSNVSSSVAPGDSVSSRGGRKPRPGKAERAAKRAAQGGVPGQPASASKAAIFASGGTSGSEPEPGKYPVVFQTGAGEPTRDSEFSYDFEKIGEYARSFQDRLIRNPRYVEFKANSGIQDDVFGRYTSVAFLLSLAQQTVHSHVNMGLPLLDYGPVNTTEVEVLSSLRTIVQQYGEHSVPSLGTRFLLAGYTETVDRLVWMADRVWSGGTIGPVSARAWLPMHARDRVTRVVIADRLNQFLENSDISISPTVLEESVLSGEVPDAWVAIKELLGDAPAEGAVDQRDRFDFIFKAYPDVAQFTTAFTAAAATAALAELSLFWANPQAGHLNWQFSAKTRFSSLADGWARASKAYNQFFSMGTVLSNRASASGSQAQFVRVSRVEEVTVVKTFLALSAPSFSLAACFPPECVFLEHFSRNVVLTTPVSVTQRATDFLLSDWK